MGTEAIDKLIELASIDQVVVSLLGFKGQSLTPVKIEELKPENGEFRIEVVAKWTGWKRRQYTGVDLVSVTDQAYTDYLKSQEPEEPEETAPELDFDFDTEDDYEDE